MAYQFWSERREARAEMGPDDECGLLQARRRLEFIERLLLKPTPQCIRDAGLLLQEANELVRQHCRLNASQIPTPTLEMRRMVLDFKELCSRVNALLAGAQRVQWTKIRAIGAITQSYTATARVKDWKPQTGTINLRF